MTSTDDPSEVGQQFFYGAGRKKSYRQAFPYLVRAAELNDPHCQNLVGFCYSHGLGVEKDKRLALFWYDYAASNDDKEALEILRCSMRREMVLRPTCGKHSLFTKELPSLVMHGPNATWQSHT